MTDLFDRFRLTAFRYEGQPLYAVGGEAEALRAWRERRPRPERSIRTSPFLRRMAETHLAGKEWSRARIADEPAPEYLLFQATTGYVENQAVGERIVMVPRTLAPAELPDFWLFDGGTTQAAGMFTYYDATGEFAESIPIDDPATLRDLDQVRRDLIAAGRPLADWLAERRCPRG